MSEIITKRFQDKVAGIGSDPQFEALEKKYLPYLELHGIKNLSAVFEVKQTAPGEALSGKLIWHVSYDLPIDLKRELIRLFHRHFKT